MLILNCKTKTLLPFHISILDKNELHVNEGVLELMKRHISILGEEIRQYFRDLKDFQKYCRFVNNLFGTSVGGLPSQDNLLEEQFIDMVNDGNVRSLFSEKYCGGVWIEMAQTYPDISKMALRAKIVYSLRVLIPFPTTLIASLHFRRYLPSSQKLETD